MFPSRLQLEAMAEKMTNQEEQVDQELLQMEPDGVLHLTREPDGVVQLLRLHLEVTAKENVRGWKEYSVD
jgi:hypothetical protein